MPPKRAIIWSAVSTLPQADDDKFSLEDQIEEGQALAAQYGWQVAEILRVPGHSRSYRLLEDVAAEARQKHIYAFDRLIDHLARHDFDVLICRDANRFARKASLMHYIIECIVEDCNANIFSMADNLLVDEKNADIFAMVKGYMTNHEMKWLKEAHEKGMNKRAVKGLPTTSYGHIYSHTVVEVGKDEYKAIVNESTRRLFADVAELLLDGISWQQMPDLLAERGHRRRSGHLFSPSTLRKWLMHPTFWGNSAQHFQDGDHFSVARGFWVFDSLETAPEYVQIYYGTHEPMYTGALAENVKAELRRRYGSNGKAHPKYKNVFTGLVVCDDCRYAMAYKREKRYVAMRCTSHRHPGLQTDCTNSRYISERKLIKYADDLLRAVVDGGDWSAFFPQLDSAAQLVDHLVGLEGEINEKREQANRLIAKQSTMPASVGDLFDAQIKVLAETVEALQNEHRRLSRQAQDALPTDAQRQAAQDVRLLFREGKFWTQADQEVNQWLYRILGKWRFVVQNAEVVALSPEPKRYKLPERD